jgi:hypothetical protein
MTDAALPGQKNAGKHDAFVRKYDPSGNALWSRQFGTPEDDGALGVAASDNGLYVVGYTLGALPGQTSAGGGDSFVRKYDPDGRELWTRQFGSTASDLSGAVAVDGSGIYVVGITEGALTGQRHAGKRDAFVRKYDISGKELWTRQFGTPETDEGYGASADGNTVYVAGYTWGALPGQTKASAPGEDEAFVRKYDARGNELWTRQFGGSEGAGATHVVADALGCYLAGVVNGTLPGQTGVGGITEVFVRHYDPGGKDLRTRQFGIADVNLAQGIALDSKSLYVIASTYGRALADQTRRAPAFLIKIAR